MKTFSGALMKSLLMLLPLVLSSVVSAEEGERRTRLDAFWSDVSQAVEAGDFAAYRAAHHPDGVLVMGGQSLTLEAAHKGFEPGFEHTADGLVEAGIEFRWTERSGGPSTALEKGAFRYWSKAEGSDYVQYTPLEVVLVMGESGWQILVQTQGEALTEEQWEQMPATDGG